MSNIKLFQDKKIRRQFDSEKEDWFYSVVDVVEALTDSPHPRIYWRTLKNRLKAEGSEVYTNCIQLKMEANDGKVYNRDAMSTKDILRLIQSIPSPKAEPFKLWLAEVGNDRIEEIYDTDKAIQRALIFHYVAT